MLTLVNRTETVMGQVSLSAYISISILNALQLVYVVYSVYCLNFGTEVFIG